MSESHVSVFNVQFCLYMCVSMLASYPGPNVQNAEKGLVTLGKILYVLCQQSLFQVDE